MNSTQRYSSLPLSVSVNSKSPSGKSSGILRFAILACKAARWTSSLIFDTTFVLISCCKKKKFVRLWSLSRSSNRTQFSVHRSFSSRLLAIFRPCKISFNADFCYLFPIAFYWCFSTSFSLSTFFSFFFFIGSCNSRPTVKPLLEP